MSVGRSRLFSPGAFEAARAIRALRQRHPLMSAQEAAGLAEALSADGYDFEAGAILESELAADTSFVSASKFYRDCIEALVQRNPIWIKLITLGRQKFVQKLPSDEQNCFEFSGLLSDPPLQDVIDWWDRIAGASRKEQQLAIMERARQAEQLSLEHERTRLSTLGINLKPLWVAFEDNTLGYDIISYDQGTPSPVSRLIEVKSTIVSPLRFHVSRNEWDEAIKYGSRYFFHIWDLRGPTLHIRTASEIALKIPSDNASGLWQNAIIPV